MTRLRPLASNGESVGKALPIASRVVPGIAAPTDSWRVQEKAPPPSITPLRRRGGPPWEKRMTRPPAFTVLGGGPPRKFPPAHWSLDPPPLSRNRLHDSE